MPFTPFHLGPALLLGLLTYRYLDLPSLLLASLLVDMRAALVLFGVLEGPLHGILTTLAGSAGVGIAVALAIHPLRSPVNSIMEVFKMDQQPSLPVAIGSGIVGAWSHVLLDSVLYMDAQPFTPLPGNPFLGLVPPSAVYGFTIICFLAALLLYTRIYYKEG